MRMAILAGLTALLTDPVFASGTYEVEGSASTADQASEQEEFESFGHASYWSDGDSTSLVTVALERMSAAAELKCGASGTRAVQIGVATYTGHRFSVNVRATFRCQRDQ